MAALGVMEDLLKRTARGRSTASVTAGGGRGGAPRPQEGGGGAGPHRGGRGGGPGPPPPPRGRAPGGGGGPVPASPRGLQDPGPLPGRDLPRGVAGPAVHDDHVRIRADGLDGGGQALLLVEGGNHDGDGGSHQGTGPSIECAS